MRCPCVDCYRGGMRIDALIVPRVRIARLSAASDLSDDAVAQMEAALNGRSRCTPCDSCFGSEQCLYDTRTIRVPDLVGDAFVAVRGADRAYAGSICVTPAARFPWAAFFAHVCTGPAIMVSTLCVRAECRGDHVGSMLVRHVLRQYGADHAVYLTVRPKRPESECSPASQGARREINGRFDGLLAFYAKHGFAIVERTPHLWLLRRDCRQTAVTRPPRR